MRSIKEKSLSSDNFDQFRQWVKDGIFVCNSCLFKAAQDEQRLACSRCMKMLSRINFPPYQRLWAKKEDKNPDHLGRNPVYTCMACIPSLQEKKRKRQTEFTNDISSTTHRSYDRWENSDHPPRNSPGSSKDKQHIQGSHYTKQSRSEDDDKLLRFMKLGDSPMKIATRAIGKLS